MKNRFFYYFSMCCFLLSLTGCASVYEAFIGVDSETKERFAVVPVQCENGLDNKSDISRCTQALMPIGRDFGELALARIEDYGAHAQPATQKILPEFKEKIAKNCIEHIDNADNLFAKGKEDIAVEIALGSLSDCFFRCDEVMERSYAGMEAGHLRDVTSRALDKYYQSIPMAAAYP